MVCYGTCARDIAFMMMKTIELTWLKRLMGLKPMIPTHGEDEVELLGASREVHFCAEYQVVDGTHVEGVPQLQVL